MKLVLTVFAALLVLGPTDAALAQRRRPGPPPPPPPTTCEEGRTEFLPVDGAALQAALDCAQPGAMITLTAGAVYQGNFTLRHKPQALTPKVITIESSALSSLPEDVRVAPEAEVFMPSLRAPEGSSAPVLATELKDLGGGREAASYYVLRGLKIFTLRWTDTLVRLGTGTEAAVGELPTNITIDRSYLAGSPTEGTRRGVVANGNNIVITNSHFEDFKDTSSDAQAIVAWNGAGPFEIINNHLEGSGENVMFGGGDPSIEDLVPADIRVERNWFVKPLHWTSETSRRKGASNRKPWLIKNLFELKNAERVSIVGNIFQNNWIQADQRGFAIVLTPRNQDGNAPWSRVRDVTFSYNRIENSTAGFNLLATDDTFPSGPLKTISIEHNLLLNIGDTAVPGTDPGDRAGRLIQILNPDGDALPLDLTFNRNTAFSSREVTFSALNWTSDVTMTANVVRHNPCDNGNDCGISGDGTAPGNASLDAWFEPPVAVTGNVFFAAGGNRASAYPSGNVFPDVAAFKSDCASTTPTIEQDTGLSTGVGTPDYTAVNASCAPAGVGVDWRTLKELTDRARSGR